ncbi:hypothetical protein Zmor_021322 [Zophobas morio]|uniref:Uncharacterized protein n=1 Tax=Zophobas morio TaxID=2755281 RepID=A0AA38I2N5_9CUCU|nr:hypothetical protein Zmor_021322 [Zophobas morio]
MLGNFSLSSNRTRFGRFLARLEAADGEMELIMDCRDRFNPVQVMELRAGSGTVGPLSKIYKLVGNGATNAGIGEHSFDQKIASALTRVMLFVKKSVRQRNHFCNKHKRQVYIII